MRKVKLFSRVNGELRDRASDLDMLELDIASFMLADGGDIIDATPSIFASYNPDGDLRMSYMVAVVYKSKKT